MNISVIVANNSVLPVISPIGMLERESIIDNRARFNTVFIRIPPLSLGRNQILIY